MFGILKNKKNISDAKVDKIEFNEELYYRIIYELKVKINDTWQKIYEIQFDRENCMNEDLYRYFLFLLESLIHLFFLFFHYFLLYILYLLYNGELVLYH